MEFTHLGPQKLVAIKVYRQKYAAKYASQNRHESSKRVFKHHNPAMFFF